jgi:hypothetical protein
MLILKGTYMYSLLNKLAYKSASYKMIFKITYSVFYASLRYWKQVKEFARQRLFYPQAILT